MLEILVHISSFFFGFSFGKILLLADIESHLENTEKKKKDPKKRGKERQLNEDITNAAR